jgi:hypothetical protein
MELGMLVRKKSKSRDRCWEELEDDELWFFSFEVIFCYFNFTNKALENNFRSLLIFLKNCHFVYEKKAVFFVLIERKF